MCSKPFTTKHFTLLRWKLYIILDATIPLLFTNIYCSNFTFVQLKHSRPGSLTTRCQDNDRDMLVTAAVLMDAWWVQANLGTVQYICDTIHLYCTHFMADPQQQVCERKACCSHAAWQLTQVLSASSNRRPSVCLQSFPHADELSRINSLRCQNVPRNRIPERCVSFLSPSKVSDKWYRC